MIDQILIFLIILMVNSDNKLPKLGVYQIALLLRIKRKDYDTIGNAKDIFQLPDSRKGDYRSLGILEVLEVMGLMKRIPDGTFIRWILSDTDERIIDDHITQQYGGDSL